VIAASSNCLVTRRRSGQSGAARIGECLSARLNMRRIGHAGETVMKWIALAGLASFIVAAVLAARRVLRDDARQRLVRHLASQPSCNAWVRKRSDPRSWLRVTEWSDGAVQTEEGALKLTEIVAFVVAYPSGDELDHWGALGEPPEAVHHWLKKETPPVAHELTERMLEAGNRLVRFHFGRSASRPSDRRHYSTSLTNVSNQPFRVRRFAGYCPEGDKWVLSTITDSFFTDAQFVEWYGVGADGWVQPGETVEDPSNYGSPPVLWAFELETSDGTTSWAGGIHH